MKTDISSDDEKELMYYIKMYSLGFHGAINLLRSDGMLEYLVDTETVKLDILTHAIAKKIRDTK